MKINFCHEREIFFSNEDVEKKENPYKLKLPQESILTILALLVQSRQKCGLQTHDNFRCNVQQRTKTDNDCTFSQNC